MIDLDKVVFASPYNAYKNVNSYSGSLTFPTSVAPGTIAAPTTTIQLTEAPVFTVFNALFVSFNDQLTNNPTDTLPQLPSWYAVNMCSFDVGIYTTSPFPGWLSCGILPVINGTTVTVTGQFQNPTASTITLAPLTVPFIFVEYTLAN